MFLFRNSLKYSKDYEMKLEKFVIFVCLYYSEQWFTARIAADAPFMDLQFYKNMLKYRKNEPEIAEAVLKKFLGHTWYLNQEYVPLSLFSKRVSDKEKSEIAKQLSELPPMPITKATKNTKGYSLGQPWPVSLSHDTDIGLRRELSESVMGGSMFLFDILNFEKGWLQKSVSDWDSDAGFCEMRSWVHNLKVTNDCAERGIKLISDFANSLTKNPEDRQNLLQVVERHRNFYPDVRKATLAKNH